MAQLFAPSTEADLAETIAAGGPFHLQGLGSKAGFGHAVAGDTLSLQNFAGVVVYEPEELILEAGTATPLSDIAALLRQRQQMLAFEPPDHSHLWGGTSSGSLGGVLACGLGGPRRIKAGSARDHVLGLRGVTGRGEIFKAGARVVKNVTGYDMPKLMTGSFGTLAAMTSVIFKVLPAPETEETILVHSQSDAEAIAVMTAALQSAAEVSAAAHVPGQGTYLRLEGIAISVAARRDSLVKRLGAKHDCLAETDSNIIWRAIRDCRILVPTHDEVLWRISVPPSEGARVASALSAVMACRYMFDWAGGLVWLVTAASDCAKVREHLPIGQATVYAGQAMTPDTPVFHPQHPTVAALTQRLKLAFDPLAKLNPGRMYPGV